MIPVTIAEVPSVKIHFRLQDEKIQGVTGLAARAIALLLCVSLSGCHVLASASASHGGGTRCVDDRTFTLIDIGITIGAGVLIATDDDPEDTSKWVFAIPGVFLASALLGVVETHRCRAKQERDNGGPGYERSGPVLYRSGSPSALPQPVSEEPGVEASQPLPPIPSKQVESLRLPENYVPDDSTPEASSTGPPACGVDNKFACPKGQVCSMKDDKDGSCVPRNGANPEAE